MISDMLSEAAIDLLLHDLSDDRCLELATLLEAMDRGLVFPFCSLVDAVRQKLRGAA